VRFSLRSGEKAEQELWVVSVNLEQALAYAHNRRNALRSGHVIKELEVRDVLLERSDVGVDDE
jgi:hypothetical protein